MICYKKINILLIFQTIYFIKNKTTTSLQSMKYTFSHTKDFWIEILCKAR